MRRRDFLAAALAAPASAQILHPIVAGAQIARTGLVGAWDFTNLAGGTQSVSGAFGTSLAAQLGATAGVDATDPTISAAGLALDGSDDYVDCGAPAGLNFTSEFTLQIVAKVVSAPEAAWRWILGKNSDANATAGYFLARSNSGTLELMVAGVFTGGYWRRDSDYHLITAVFKGGQFMRVYVDDTLFSERTTGVPAAAAVTAQKLGIGRTFYYGSPTLEATVPLVLAYNVALPGPQYSAVRAHLGRRGLNVLPARQALATVEFDDGYATDLTAAKPILDGYEIVGCSAVATDLIGTPSYMTWGQVLQLQAGGWEILSHTKTHTSLATYTEQQTRDEFTAAEAAFAAQGISTPNLVYPQHSYNATTMAVAAEFFRSARGTSSNYPNPETLPLYELYANQCQDPASIETYKQSLRQCAAENGWFIFYQHGNNASLTSVLQTMIPYAKSLGIRFVTVQQALDLLGAPAAP